MIRLLISKRDATGLDRREISTILSNQIRTFMIDIELDYTGQRSTLSLDTGSSDTWIFTPSACDDCEGGSCNENHSFTDVPRPDLGKFETSHLDGTVASGTHHNDDVLIGDTKISNITFAMVNQKGKTHHGILGLGPQALQSSSLEYPTILDAMKSQGLIDWRKFSIQLNLEAADDGLLVFGGWDTINCPYMPTVPMWKEEGQAHRLAIDWTSIEVLSGNGNMLYSNTNISQPVVLATGYTLSTSLDNMLNTIAREFGVKKSGDNYYCSCKQPPGGIECRLGDSQLSVTVPFSEFTLPADLQPGRDTQDNLCMFGLRPALSWGTGNDMLFFGDTVLRSAYLLVDYDVMMIGLCHVNPARSKSEASASR